MDPMSAGFVSWAKGKCDQVGDNLLSDTPTQITYADVCDAIAGNPEAVAAEVAEALTESARWPTDPQWAIGRRVIVSDEPAAVESPAIQRHYANGEPTPYFEYTVRVKNGYLLRDLSGRSSDRTGERNGNQFRTDPMERMLRVLRAWQMTPDNIEQVGAQLVEAGFPFAFQSGTQVGFLIPTPVTLYLYGIGLDPSFRRALMRLVVVDFTPDASANRETATLWMRNRHVASYQEKVYPLNEVVSLSGVSAVREDHVPLEASRPVLHLPPHVLVYPVEASRAEEFPAEVLSVKVGSSTVGALVPHGGNDERTRSAIAQGVRGFPTAIGLSADRFLWLPFDGEWRAMLVKPKA